LVTFRGRPVKRRQCVAGGLQLIFFSATAGSPGEKLIVSEADWQTFGRVQFYPPGLRPDVRKLASIGR
jgi:hypothetical protein